MAGAISSAGRKSVTASANLLNLLPTGTVLSFQALLPSFSNSGSCLPANRYLTSAIIVFCSLICFLSSFTDSFIDQNGKLHYGIATFKGLYIFNQDDNDDDDNHDPEKGDGSEKKRINDVLFKKALAKLRIKFRDCVHAILTLVVFLVFAFTNSDVKHCFFPHWGANGNQVMINLPLGVSALASAVFMIFPTKRRGIGVADKKTHGCKKCDSSTQKSQGDNNQTKQNNN